MNRLSPFLRKVVYLVLVGALLIPVSLISRPASTTGTGVGGDAGGVISEMRMEYRLSQSQLSEIDPTSETMKLATMGLRGVAVNLLWLQANEQKKKEEWDNFEATLNALIKIQPNFVRVWEFQAHNLSYNISLEFDDFEYRYTWVRKGIEFLASGIQYNLREHKILDGLGDFTGMKIGNSDEKFQYRRMFRADTDFQSRMSQYIAPNLYDTRHPVYGHDHWRMAYWWYDKSQKLVQNEGVTKRTNDLVYYMKKPSQIRHQAITLETEFRTDDDIRDIWREAEDKWDEYGDQRIVTSIGNEVTLSGLSRAFQDVVRLREKLDQMLPDVRENEMPSIYENLGFSAEQIKMQRSPMETIGEFEMPKYRALNEMVNFEMRKIDQMIFEQLPPEHIAEARGILSEIDALSNQLEMTEKYQGTANFLYWVDRCKMEQTEEGMLARQAWYDASEMRRKSIFDDEYRFDYSTQKKVLTKTGAVTSLLDVFSRYHALFDKYPMLPQGDLGESMIDTAREFRQMTTLLGIPWPEDFPMQDLIDNRAATGDVEGLPTKVVKENATSEPQGEKKRMEGEMPDRKDPSELPPNKKD